MKVASIEMVVPLLLGARLIHRGLDGWSRLVEVPSREGPKGLAPWLMTGFEIVDHLRGEVFVSLNERCLVHKQTTIN